MVPGTCWLMQEGSCRQPTACLKLGIGAGLGVPSGLVGDENELTYGLPRCPPNLLCRYAAVLFLRALLMAKSYDEKNV